MNTAFKLSQHIVICLQLPDAAISIPGRFWPNGLYGNATKTARMRMDLGGLHTDSWCAVGLAMPEGTRLRFRFHVGRFLSCSQRGDLLSSCACFAVYVLQPQRVPSLRSHSQRSLLRGQRQVRSSLVGHQDLSLARSWNDGSADLDTSAAGADALDFLESAGCLTLGNRCCSAKLQSINYYNATVWRSAADV